MLCLRGSAPDPVPRPHLGNVGSHHCRGPTELRAPGTRDPTIRHFLCPRPRPKTSVWKRWVTPLQRAPQNCGPQGPETPRSATESGGSKHLTKEKKCVDYLIPHTTRCSTTPDARYAFDISAPARTGHSDTDV